jgi:hypothetical protein
MGPHVVAKQRSQEVQSERACTLLQHMDMSVMCDVCVSLMCVLQE